MINHIQTIDDVKSFARQIIAEGTSFHPDDDFNDYVNFDDKKPCYSKQDADFRNALMNNCFNICEKEGKDIYDVMLEVTLIETGMDKIIPIPS
jgi:hypothetical protein